LEQYLNENKHLPGMLSSEEIEEMGGIPVGETQIKHLEKTEEAFLYIIELKKEIEMLKKDLLETKMQILLK
jgi:hypothetical protein